VLQGPPLRRTLRAACGELVRAADPTHSDNSHPRRPAGGASMSGAWARIALFGAHCHGATLAPSPARRGRVGGGVAEGTAHRHGRPRPAGGCGVSECDPMVPRASDAASCGSSTDSRRAIRPAAFRAASCPAVRARMAILSAAWGRLVARRRSRPAGSSKLHSDNSHPRRPAGGASMSAHGRESPCLARIVTGQARSLPRKAGEGWGGGPEGTARRHGRPRPAGGCGVSGCDPVVPTVATPRPAARARTPGVPFDRRPSWPPRVGPFGRGWLS
jgi:hypothetical protein